MTTYKEIFGKYVKNYSSDPSSDIEGQIWYNSTSGTFKTNVNIGGVWVAGGNMTTGVFGSMQFGIQTAGVAASGLTPVTRITDSQEYDGSSWSSGGTVGTGRYLGGAGGTLTAGLIFGGESPVADSNATEEYDGSTWSPSGNMSKARRTTGAGVQTAALAIGGYDNVNKLANVEEYNGSSWTAGTNLPLSGFISSGSGLASSARVAGGIYGPGATHPPSSPQTFNNNIGWNGTSWSNDTVVPANRFNNSGFGTSEDNYYTAGGRTPPTTAINTTIYWNGSAWSSLANLATARWNGQGINGTPSAFYFAGGNSGSTATEEFTDPTFSTKTITTS